MGLQDFTGGGQGPTAPGGQGPSLPMMGPASQAVSDVTEIMIDYNKRFKTADPTLFRDDLVSLMMSVLISKTKPNPLLVGSAGVGKTRIVEEVARLIANDSPAVPPSLKGCTVWELPLSALVAGAGIVGELETRVTEVIDYATDPKNKAVLFIDEIHLLADDNSRIYSKVAQILKPALARGDMHLIGATTSMEGKALDDDPALARRFSRLVVDELTLEQTAKVLESARPGYHSHYNAAVSVPDEVVARCAVVANEVLPQSLHRPDNALTLLDRAMADTVVQHSAMVAEALDKGDQILAATLKGMLPISLTETKLRSVAMRLTTGLARKRESAKDEVLAALSGIVGQDDAIGEVVAELERRELAVFPSKRPLSWIFAGPSGVGKTQVTKVLAEAVTGQPPIMLNMGEYSLEHDLSKLIGSGPGYVGSDSNKELPFDTLESNPYRVILLDELEKAHRSVHRLLLSALDEGWMRMASGTVIDFSRAIVIATTNAGREELSGKQAVGFGSDLVSTRATHPQVVKILEKSFDAEFLGRFTSIIPFAPLGIDEYQTILSNYYRKERERIAKQNPSLARKLPLGLDPARASEITRATYSRSLGARPAEAAARREIEDLLLAPAQQAAPVLVLDDDQDEQ